MDSNTSLETLRPGSTDITRDKCVAAVNTVLAAVPDEDDRWEVLRALFAPGKARRKSANATARSEKNPVPSDVPDATPQTTSPKPSRASKRQTDAGPRCPQADEFEAAGYRVGRCLACGELAPLRTIGGTDGDHQALTGHPTIAATGGGS